MDHDLRHDQEAAILAAAARGWLRCNTTWYAGSDTSSQRLEPSQLRTVRQADPRYPDTRTADERTTAELVRLVDAVQALRLEFDVLREELKAGRL